MRVTRLIFFLSFIFFNISNLASGQIKFTELSWDETNKLISEQFDKPILLYFYFDGCGVCKKMEKSTFQDTAVFEYLNKHYLCYKINVDSFNDFKKWKQAEKWSIRSIELEENYSNIDTYANILFKLGNSKKALEIAEKAIWLAKANNEDFSATTQLIEKIKTAME